MKAHDVAQKLRGKPTRGGYLCRCPVPSHGQGRGDRNPSLTVADGDKGLLVSCHSGCDPNDVLAAIGYEPTRSTGTSPNRPDPLSFNAAPRQEEAKPFYDAHLIRDGYRQTACYPYATQDGTLLYEVLRYEHGTLDKQFLQRRPNGSGGYWSGGGNRKVLYRWSDLARYGHTVVYVTEGEKDADRLASLNVLAVTVASGKWTQEAIEALKGYECRILEDNDKAGREKALKAAKALYGVAASIRIVRIPGLGEREDVSDWLNQGGDVSRLHGIATTAPEWQPEEAPEADRSEPTAGLPFTAFDDLAVNVRKPSIMKGVLARRETSSWIGSPGAGKSALTTDLFVHVAFGRNWRGYRSKEHCAVVILAFERADLLERRLEAYRRRHDLKGLPIAIVKAPVDLMQPESVAILTETIRSVERRFSLPVGVLGIDTFAKAIALGGGDENSAKDQNRVLGHLRLVQNATDVHVALVGHTGKDESKGARGSNAHLGDVDLMVQFSGDLVKSAVITKANDQPEGPLTTFRLETYDFGTDEDGDPITTSIVSEDVPEREAKGTQKRALTDRQKIAVDALTEALITFGREAPASLQLPKGLRTVDASKWRDELFTRGVLDRDAPNPRKEYQRIREALVTRGIVGFRDDLVWKVDQ